MKSVPPRGRGGSCDCQLSICDCGLANNDQLIDNLQLAIGKRPTRCRVVVLTSWDCTYRDSPGQLHQPLVLPGTLGEMEFVVSSAANHERGRQTNERANKEKRLLCSLASPRFAVIRGTAWHVAMV